MTVHEVSLLDLKRQNNALRDELVAAFARVLDSGHFILGPEVTGLEEECARYVGAKHAIGVSSGTDALLLALMALNVGPGDEVICPTFTFFATAGTVARTGAKPVLVDAKPCCFNIDPAEVEKKLTAKTKAIMPVHLFGQCADMGALLEIAKKRQVAVIEDAAQAIGARWRNKGAGSMGDFGCFSFFPSKNLGAFGDAGLVTTQDDNLAERARVLRVHGGKPKYYHSEIGGNFRIDALQAALLRTKLPRLEAYTAARQKNAALYTELFLASGKAVVAPSQCRGEQGDTGNRPLVLPPACQDHHIYNQYTLRVADGQKRDALRRALSDKKVGTEIYYPVPMHVQKCFSHLGHLPGEFPVAEAAAAQSLALPIFPELSADEVRYVANAVIESV